jgi:hypothetical protein
MLELLVRASLAGLSKSESLKQCDNLAGLEDRSLHLLGHGNSLNADELGLELRSTVLQEEGDDFSEVGLQLVERLGLAMRARKARHVPDIQLGVRIALDYGCERGHGLKNTRYQ